MNMHITIKIIYKGYTSRIMRNAEFPVDPFEFEINPDKEAAGVAYEWYMQIRREQHVKEIISVEYNEKHDITELVKELDK